MNNSFFFNEKEIALDGTFNTSYAMTVNTKMQLGGGGSNDFLFIHNGVGEIETDQIAINSLTGLTKSYFSSNTTKSGEIFSIADSDYAGAKEFGFGDLKPKSLRIDVESQEPPKQPALNEYFHLKNLKLNFKYLSGDGKKEISFPFNSDGSIIISDSTQTSAFTTAETEYADFIHNIATYN